MWRTIITELGECVGLTGRLWRFLLSILVSSFIHLLLPGLKVTEWCYHQVQVAKNLSIRLSCFPKATEFGKWNEGLQYYLVVTKFSTKRPMYGVQPY